MTSNQFKPVQSMPRETSRAANAIFGRGNSYIVIGEHLDTLLEDIQLQGLAEREAISRRERATWALITFFQFVEGLTDTQAVDAIRTRTDWKFALHLSLSPARLHEYVLCEFRQKALAHATSQQEFQKLLDRLTMLVPSPGNIFRNLDGIEVVTFVCSINRLNQAQQAMNQVLEILAVRFPDWLRKTALPRWYGRYNRAIPRLDVAILLGQQRFLMEEIGADIHYLLEKIHESGSGELTGLYEIKALAQLWSQQFNQASGNLSENFKGCTTCFYRTAGRKR